MFSFHSPGRTEQTVMFHGHQSYVVAIARLCKENNIFTDLTLECDDGKIAVHRLVLGAVSPFMAAVLSSLPPGLPHVTVLLPDVRRELLQQLIDFIYTGVMQLSQSSTLELQQLVTLLQIDPQNVGVDVVDEKRSARMANSKAVQSLGVKIRQKSDSPPKVSVKDNNGHKSLQTAPRSVSPVKLCPVKSSPLGVSSRKSSPSLSGKSKPLLSPSSIGGGKSSNGKLSSSPSSSCGGRSSFKLTPNSAKNSQTEETPPSGEYMSVLRSSDLSSNVIRLVSTARANKRHNSGDGRTDGGESSKEPRLADSGGGSRGRGRGGLRTRGRARGRAPSGRPVGAAKERGYHDMENVETWVCAICEKYDPVLPVRTSPEDIPPTTEWIGCDCNRWFHKFCTKLKVVDDSFSCKLLNKPCLSE